MIIGSPQLSRRSAGVLLHPTSLPGPHGIGDLGRAAYAFANVLSEARQTWWQMLPVGPVGRGNSPYSALSTYAGYPLLISLEMMAQDGLFPLRLVPKPPRALDGRVDTSEAKRVKAPLLRKASEVFKGGRRRSFADKLEHFRVRESSWLSDWSLFTALRKEYRGAPWVEWETGLRDRHAGTLAAARRRLKNEIQYQEFLQYQFHRQWDALRSYCAARGIGLVGDLPIFVAPESAEVWIHPELFHLKAGGKPSLVAGVPPDYFSKTGQLWGTPTYRWAEHRRSGYRWWIGQIKAVLSRFDVLRLDHFIGFLRCWAVPAREETAIRGRWMRGPGKELFAALRRRLGSIPVIAEDLGVVTPDVKALRDEFGFLGMRVLQFAFGNDPEAEAYKPHNYPRSCVAYTGTHDNDTVVGWFKDAGSRVSTRSRKDIRKERELVLKYLGTKGHEIHWDLIRAAWRSAADVSIVPAQDLLGLGSEARMNLPGREKGNWRWRLKDLKGIKAVSARLRDLTELYGRAPAR